MKSEAQTARHALLDAFAALVLSRRYQDVGVAQIVAKASVARSTFYYHFKAKDDLLLQNLKPMMSALARLPVTADGTREVDDWCAHIWEHRLRARGLFHGSTGRKIADALAQELQRTLGAVSSDPSGRRLAPLLAEQIAGSMLSLLRAWITGRTAATPADIGRMLAVGARALAGAYADEASAWHEHRAPRA